MSLYIVIGIVALLLIWFIVMYNGLVRSKIKIDNSWSDISVYLKKRFDMVPNLVNTVKGYAAHEVNTFERITQARNMAAAVPPGNVDQAAKANLILEREITRLFAVAESYPELKSNENFLELQRTLQEIETDLGNARRYYNATVRDYNTAIAQFPGVIVANTAGFTKRDFFELEDKAQARNVEVKF